MGKRKIDIIADDGCMFACGWPGGWASGAGAGAYGEDLLDEVREMGPGYESLRPTHRMDGDVSGVCVLARTSAAQRHIVRQFRGGAVETLYLALVGGCVEEDEGEVDKPVAPKPGGRGLMRIERKRGRPAKTSWRVLARYRGSALLLCRSQTDVRHQVRVHMQAAGYPLLVDPAYGGGGALMLSSFKARYRLKPGRKERALIARPSLHAMQMDLAHPETGASCRLQARPPKDFRAAVHQLNSHASTGVPFDLTGFPQWCASPQECAES